MRGGDPLATCRNLPLDRVAAALGYRRDLTDRTRFRRAGPVIRRRRRPGSETPARPASAPGCLPPASGAVPAKTYDDRTIFIRSRLPNPILTP